MEKAVEYYSISAAWEYGEAELAMGNMFREGDGVEQDLRKAVIYYRSAAIHGSEEARSRLEELCEFVRPDDSELAELAEESRKAYSKGDYDRAFLTARLPAEYGDKWAQEILGLCYKWGTGTRKNLKLAAKWFLKAAEAGLSASQIGRASCRERG